MNFFDCSEFKFWLDLRVLFNSSCTHKSVMPNLSGKRLQIVCPSNLFMVVVKPRNCIFPLVMKSYNGDSGVKFKSPVNIIGQYSRTCLLKKKIIISLIFQYFAIYYK